MYYEVCTLIGLHIDVTPAIYVNAVRKHMSVVEENKRTAGTQMFCGMTRFQHLGVTCCTGEQCLERVKCLVNQCKSSGSCTSGYCILFVKLFGLC